MKNKISIFMLFIYAACVNSQIFQKDRVCSSSRHIDECNQLQRGHSEVNCIYSQDAVECAQRIQNGTAEFGVFSAEASYHLASMGWEDLTVIKEIRHNDRLDQPYDFQSVVIVRSDHSGGIGNLRGVDFCHPGLHYEKHLQWTEKFLKHFERTVVQTNCSFDGKSPVESEVEALSDFFNAACRPGSWSNNPVEDKFLKEKYPKLCALCDDPVNCAYQNSDVTSSHRQALECVQKSSNAITYVALYQAQKFFEQNANTAGQFSFLCPNGTLQPVSDNQNPCVWLSQPWKLIVASTTKAVGLATSLNRWMSTNTGWESSLRQILTPDSSSVVTVRNILRLPDYVAPTRPVPIGLDPCNNGIRWCTHSYEEEKKCEVLKMAALTTGIVPNIICNPERSDTISCIDDVSKNRADFVGIDSNFGFLARHPYNLTGALFEETELDKYSSVVAIIKEQDVERIKSFEDFKEKRACFGEFGGIASIAFINIAKGRGIFRREECEFGKLLGEYFSESCFPGSRSPLHDPTSTNPDSMCALCQTQAVPSTSTTFIPLSARPLAARSDDADEDYVTEAEVEGSDVETQNVPIVPNRKLDCEAAPSNRYYGTKGALTCLHELGEVAVVEHQNLAAHAESLKLNANDFRILCRNGSLAANPGFDVDPGCILTTIVDGEIVMRRNTSKSSSVVNVLLSLDKYLQNDPNFKMYNIFNGERNLLFEDSSIGLVSPDDEKLSPSVQSYIKLFSDIENCIEERDTDSAKSTAINIVLTISLLFFTILIRN